jgi:hypothetical protein
VASKIGGFGLSSRNGHAENFVILLDFGHTEVTVKDIGPACVLERDLIQAFVVVVKSCEDG